MPDKFITAEDVEIISKLSQDETGKRQYYRPVYSLHKWWARRPGALFRSLILSAACRYPQLFVRNRGGGLCTSSAYFQQHNLKDTVILDPFMGGGTTLVEANRLGAKVIGCDLNPVSYWIVRETLKAIDLKKLDYYYTELEKSAGEKIKSLYKTRCQQCHRECDSLYMFWLRYVSCPHCGQHAYLFKTALLNKGLSRNAPPSQNNPATAFCPKCFALTVWQGSGESMCQTCGHHFDPHQGTFNQGNYTCLSCSNSNISLTNTLKKGQKLCERLITVEYLCSCRNIRTYKSPEAEDFAKIADIEETVRKLGDKRIHPVQPIMQGASSARWLNHNYRYYHEIFNARQLLSFHYLIEEIGKIPEQEYQYAFITVFSNSLEYNNMMTPYNYPHRKLHHLFNYHAMPLTTTPVENMVWGIGSEGSGTFANCYQRYFRAKQYCRQPFDKFKNRNGQISTVSSMSETVEARFVSSLKELLENPKSAWLFCGDSSKLSSVPNGCADFVITDPPYFDSIHYSELSNFFYVWLRELIRHEYFIEKHVPTQAEAIVNQGMEKGEGEYQRLLTRVFKESGRILKDRGKLIFTFHHTKWRAWWVILQSLLDSGFRVIESFPVMSEYKVNPHIRNKEAMDMDLVLICEKKSLEGISVSPEPSAILQRIVEELDSDIADHSDNQLFLYYMGEVLKTAGASQDNISDYHRFSEALTHFDDFLAKTVHTEIKKSKNKAAEAFQLQLFEPDKQKQSEKGRKS